MDAIMWPSRWTTSRRRWRFTKTFSTSNKCVAAKAMPFSNWVQVVDLHDESLVWLLPYGEVQKAGIKFDAK